MCYPRCQAARSNFDKLTKENNSQDTVFSKVLNVAPNLNSISIYATQMIPRDGIFLNEIVNGTAAPIGFTISTQLMFNQSNIFSFLK